jgi:hypothetical protein
MASYWGRILINAVNAGAVLSFDARVLTGKCIDLPCYCQIAPNPVIWPHRRYRDYPSPTLLGTEFFNQNIEAIRLLSMGTMSARFTADASRPPHGGRQSQNSPS